MDLISKKNGSCSLVIFDCDGTLINTIEDVCECFNEALANCGLPVRQPSEIARYIGLPLEQIVGGIVPPEFKRADIISAVSSEYRKAYAVNPKKHTLPFPGMIELLKYLESNGIKIAVNSNKPEENLKKLITSLFPNTSILCIGYVANRKPKPSAEGVLQLMERFGATNENTLYVGDTIVDVETAGNAGIDCAIVTWGQGTRDLIESTDMSLVCSNVGDLKKVIINKFMSNFE